VNDVSIIIPAYNEAENIRPAIERIEAAAAMPHTITVIYDSDEDTTIPVVQELCKTNDRLRLVKNKYGRGALNAIKTGLEEASGTYALVTMADLSDPPEVINALYEKAETENADIVCASRYMKGGRQNGGPFIKGCLSRIAGLTLYCFAKLPTHDATNSFKLYRVSFLKEQAIESTGGFELGIELAAKAHVQGYKICETPTTWTDRAEGKSNFKLLRWLKNYIHWYLYAFTAPQNGLLRYLPRFVTYVAAGGICALVNWGIFYVLCYVINIHYLLSASFAFVASFTANYFLSRRIFKPRGRKKIIEYILVLAASAAALAIDLCIMYMLIDFVRFPPMIAKLLGTGSAFFFNYQSRQFFIFSSEKI
jgi:glycosyltransferase involved in cell wall biosynthesis